MSNPSPLSEESQARRDAVCQAIKEATNLTDEQLNHEFLLAGSCTCEFFHEMKYKSVRAAEFQYSVDRLMWDSHFRDDIDQFHYQFPKPESTSGPLSLEYHRFLSRERKKEVRAAVKVEESEMQLVGPVRQLPLPPAPPTRVLPDVSNGRDVSEMSDITDMSDVPDVPDMSDVPDLPSDSESAESQALVLFNPRGPNQAQEISAPTNLELTDADYKHLWETLRNKNNRSVADTLPDLGIWSITLPSTNTLGFNLDEVLPTPDTNAHMFPWEEFVPVYVKKTPSVTAQGVQYTLVLRFHPIVTIHRSQADTSPVSFHAREALVSAWKDLLGWAYDLHLGKKIPLVKWTEKARANKNGAHVPRRELSFSRLYLWRSLNQLLPQAEGLLSKLPELQRLAVADGTATTDATIMRERDEYLGCAASKRNMTGLDPVRFEHAAWVSWSEHVGLDPQSEAGRVCNAYYYGTIAQRVVRQALLTILEMHCGAYDGSVDAAVEELRGWVVENPEGLLLEEKERKQLVQEVFDKVVVSQYLVGNWARFVGRKLFV